MKKCKAIYLSELDFLAHAIKDGKHNYHTFTLSSLNADFPESRTVVLRGLDKENLSIYFNADFRSPKVKQLIENPFCSALFYDKDRRVQLRCKAKAEIHYKDELSDKVWLRTPLQSRKCYMGPYSPSELLDEYHPNIPIEYLNADPEESHSNDGYINFTHIKLEVLEVDVLQLHHNGHIRFKVTNNSNFRFVSP